MKGVKFERIFNNPISVVGVAAIFLIMLVVLITCLLSPSSEINSAVANIDTESAIISNSDVDTNTEKDTDTVTSVIAIKDVNSGSDSDKQGLLPIDCNNDFWQVKLGIAECYDHVFKQGHMTDTAYYSGDCDKHEPSEIQKLAKEVKLYREDTEYGGYAYSATLPEIGWSIMIDDPKIQAIIDAQINGVQESMYDDISIVLYFYENTINIEIAE